MKAPQTEAGFPLKGRSQNEIILLRSFKGWADSLKGPHPLKGLDRRAYSAICPQPYTGEPTKAPKRQGALRIRIRGRDRKPAGD